MHNIDVNKLLLDSKVLMQRKHFQKAEDMLSVACKAGVSHSDVYYLLGECRRLLGYYKEAEDALLKCISFDLHSPYALCSLGLTYIQLENFDLAAPLLQ